MSLRERIKKKKNILQENAAQATSENNTNGQNLYNRIKDELNEYVNDNINFELLADKDNETDRKTIIKDCISKRIDTYYQNTFISNVDRQKLILDVLNENNYFGPLSELYEDSSIDTIYVNGPNEVLVEKDNKLFRTSVTFKDEKHLGQIINKIFYKYRNSKNCVENCVSVKMLNGTSISAVLPPIAVNGGYLVIKKFKKNLCNFSELVNKKFLTQEIASFLKYSYFKGLNIIITGEKETGKTTLLGALVKGLPLNKRTVFVRQGYEIDEIPYGYLILNEAKTEDENIFEAVKILRAEEIIYPEIDKQDLFESALNLNSNLLTTVDAKSAKELMLLMARELSFENEFFDKKMIKDCIADVVDLFVTTGRDDDGAIRVLAIEQPAKNDDNLILQPIITFDKETKQYKSCGTVPSFVTDDEMDDFDIGLDFFDVNYHHLYDISLQHETETDVECVDNDAPVTEFKHEKKNSIRSRFKK